MQDRVIIVFTVTEYGEFGLDAFIFHAAIKLQETIT